MSEHSHAVEALRQAGRLENAAWRGSNWYLRFLWVYGLAQLVIAPVLVLGRGPASTFVSVGVNTAVVVSLSIYAARQRTLRRGFGMRHGAVIGGWGAAFGLTAALGSTLLHDSVQFAVSATLVCALPFAVGAWFEIRRPA